MYRLIAMDLDGTLVNSDKVITPRTLSALRRAQDKGVRLAIATGRPVEGARHIVEELDMQHRGGCLVSYNGALVQDCTTGETLYEKPLPEEYVPRLLRTATDSNCAFVVYQGDRVLTTDASSEYVQYSGRNNRLPVKQATDFMKETVPPFYKGLIVGEPGRMASLRDSLIKEMDGALDFCLSEPFFLECLAQGVSKMGGVEKVMARMGINATEVMAFGDADNDVSMIRRAGLGVAMGNAHEQARRVADIVTASNDADGVAEVVERYVL